MRIHLKFLLVCALITIAWLFVFELKKPDRIDWNDVFFEGTFTMSLVFFYCLVLRGTVDKHIVDGFNLVLIANLMDVLDEFTKEPSFFDTDIQYILRTAGMILIGLGLRKTFLELRMRAFKDSLTGLFNRNYFEYWKDREGGKLTPPVSVVMMDIDNMKQLNDEYSHIVGDTALRILGSALSASLREEDLSFRYGGDEFLVILPGASSSVAERVLKRFLKNLESNTKFLKFPIEVSYGIAEMEEGESIEDVIERADSAMLDMKRKKRGSLSP